MPYAWTTCSATTTAWPWDTTTCSATTSGVLTPDGLCTAATAWIARHVTDTSTAGFFTQGALPGWPSGESPSHRVSPPPRVRSEAEQAEAARVCEASAWQRRERLAAQERARSAARARAEALLQTHLDAVQRQQYEVEHCFDVGSADGARTYRLAHGVTHNVALLDPDTGRAIRTYCAHPGQELPVADVLLAQMLLLTCDEAAFLRVANVRNLTE